MQSRFIRWSRTFAKWLAVLVVVAGAIYWLRFRPVPVQRVPVRSGLIVSEIIGTGTLEARVSTTISPKISGRITVVSADQGDAVAEGDLLVELDAAELQQQVEIAEANVAAAQAAIVRLSADKERATVVLDQTQRTSRRLESLLERSATSQEEFERATEAMSVAVADVARAEAAITEGQKVLLAAEKTLQYHQARLRDTRILAPFSGLITARHRESGDVVVPGSGILTLISTDVLWISAWVDETEMSRVAKDQPARIVFRSQPEQSYPGTVVRLANESDRETREFVVDVQANALPNQWAVGQRAEVYLETGRKSDAIQIDAASLVRTDDGHAVFVNDAGVARLRPVTLGLRGRDSVEVILGLSATDQVVMPRHGSAALVDGRHVSVDES
ncbi:efflux RND transporter periplasmic adaptor subunit [Stieleria sp.]|uniref:efflux RND transporter periplasmic adaptor subunit n=1 Tax=Stieleria sp. TaxID=2795976 RepID=UPI003561323C